MKRFILVVVLLFALVFVIIQAAKAKIGKDLSQPILETVLSPTPSIAIDPNQKTVNSVFVPYWAIGDETFNGYDQYLYFGITPNAKGISEEEGYARIDAFRENVPQGKKTLLVLRMVDSEVNANILKDKNAQARIIDQSVSYAKQNGFSGIVLDLEMSAIPFDSLVDQISTFSNNFATKTKEAKLEFTMALYGDTFYRLRPFDVKSLSEANNTFMLMAYDFHKSRSNPGPNFPMQGKETYGYDMTELADDILQYTSPKNVTIIFGMFGYDWEVDNNGKAISQGSPLTYKEIEQKFLDDCDYTSCAIKRDALSAETRVTYTDSEGQKHVVWFEDMTSVRQKQQYLRTRGITSFSFWAYSYF